MTASKVTMHRDASTWTRGQLAELWRLRMVHTDVHYLSDLMRRQCCADLLALGVFGKSPAKEVTEASALREAAVRYLDCDPRDPGIVVVCPGDGAQPRTAAFVAFTTRWTAVAVDPLLAGWCARYPDGVPTSGAGGRTKVERLTTIPDKVEAARGSVRLLPGQRGVVLACHSHAPLADALAVFDAPPGEVAVAAMGCCVPQELEGRAVDREYVDDGVASPQRVVRVWRSVAGGAT